MLGSEAGNTAAKISASAAAGDTPFTSAAPRHRLDNALPAVAARKTHIADAAGHRFAADDDVGPRDPDDLVFRN